MQDSLYSKDGRSTLYVIPIEVLVASIQSTIYRDPPGEYSGLYIKIEDKTGRIFVRIHSEFNVQCESMQSQTFAVIVFESEFDAPARGVHAGKRKLFAIPYPFAQLAIQSLGKPMKFETRLSQDYMQRFLGKH